MLHNEFINSECQKQLKELTGKKYYMYREHYKFGYHPTYRTNNKKDPKYFYDYVDGTLTPFLEEDFLARIKDLWRPADQEGQDEYRKMFS